MRHVSCGDTRRVQVHQVVPYSLLYGIHPSLTVPTRKGIFKRVSSDSDSYSGKSSKVMQARRVEVYPADRLQEVHRRHAEALSSVLHHGACWERDRIPSLTLMSV